MRRGQSLLAYESVDYQVFTQLYTIPFLYTMVDP